MPERIRPTRQRPLSASYLRAFAAVAKHLNFRAAAQELALTQSAVSRQIQALEHEVGASLFLRHTRSVELTNAGELLHRACSSALAQIDSAVQHIRHKQGRPLVSITTWASFASMWLIPRLEIFQRAHPEIDIRIDASDKYVDLSTSDVDLALRYEQAQQMPATAVRLFGEQITPVASRWLLQHQAIHQISDLQQCTLIESGDIEKSPHLQWLSWQRWLKHFAADTPQAPSRNSSPSKLAPQRWLYFNYAYQNAQAALAGQGVALARLPLVAENLLRGELIEVLPETRLQTPIAYWLMVAPHAKLRPEVLAFCEWLNSEALKTRQAMGE
ncbi:MAG: LysR family transcriptional regulator [Betaproteobacteria bacterium]|nr:LysR family transcriptional regulator [Betaproteobacteria bacterium]